MKQERSSFLKKNTVTFLLSGFLLLIIFSPGAKAWFLQKLVSVGIFRATINKDGVSEQPSSTAFLYSNEDGTVSTTADLKGKIIIINFWASWCTPCQAEMPALENLYKKLQNDNRFVFLFINEDDDKNHAMNYLSAKHLSIPLFSRTGNIPHEIFSGTIPTTVVLDKNGRIVMRHEGIAGYDNEGFIKQLKELL